jgi:hypothetical protein
VGSNVFLFSQPAGSTPAVTLVSHAAGASMTRAAGNSSSPAIDGDGGLVTYLSTATNLVPSQSGGGVHNVFGWVRNGNLNFLTSGQNGSSTMISPFPTFLPIISRDPVILFNVAGGLLRNVTGATTAVANKLVDFSLTPLPLLDGSGPNTPVGTLTALTVLTGQLGAPPLFTLPAGAASDNGRFTAGTTNALDGTASLLIQFPVNIASQSSFNILVQVDFGQFENTPILVSRTFTLTAVVGPATYFRVNVPTNATAGTPLSVTVTALDAAGNTATGYTGTVHVSSSDAQATLPANYTFTAADQGVHTFTCMLAVAANDTISVNDMDTTAIAVSATVTVQPAAPSSLAFVQQPPSSTAAGSPIPPVSVQVLDAYGNRVSTDQSDTVTITLAANPGGGSLSGTLTVSVQNGVATFTDLVTGTLGSGYTLQATATGLGSVTSTVFNVTTEVLTGTVFIDSNTNGVQDTDEPGLAGQTVFLDLDGSGVLQASDPTALTDSSGYFQLGVPSPGLYTIRLVLLGGVLLSTPTSGSYPVTVSSGVNLSGQNFAEVPTSIAVPLTLPPSTAFPQQGNANADYVEALYRAILNRDADAGGLASWTSQLNSGTLSRLQVVQGIRQSAEHFSQEVTDFYFTFLGRAPDDPGLQSWVQNLQNGLTEEKMAFYFLDSPEYLSKGDKHFVDQMYESVLGRTFDASGEANWLNALGDDASGSATHTPSVTHEAVITGFVNSPESLTRVTEGFYQVYLQRLADPGGLSNWVAALQQGGSFLAIGQQFLASDEFYNRAAQNG